MKDNNDLGIKTHYKTVFTHGDIINKNRKNDVSHNMLLYAKITTNIYQYPIS